MMKTTDTSKASPGQSPPAGSAAEPAACVAPCMAAPFDPDTTAGMPLAHLLHFMFQEIWCRGNLGAVSKVMTAETIVSGAVSALAGPDCDYGEVVDTLRSLVGPMKVRFTHAMETRDWVSVRLLIDTSSPKGGTAFHITGQIMARVENGKIAELHSNMDYFQLFEQLGQLPPEALAICMTGERLG